MARRPRNSRGWRFVLSGVRREQDTRAPALAAGADACGYDSDGQQSNSDSDTELLHLPPSIPSAVPVTGESYCGCDSQNDAYCSSLHTFNQIKSCQCGEEDDYFDWVWDDGSKSTATVLSSDNRKMVGIGTSDVNLDKYRHTFCSLLGKDAESWGLSYTGLLQHKGDKSSYSSRFGQGSIIGVHLDTWHGVLTFYKNRKCIGVAATQLRNKKLFPMVCSTAAKSSMKVIRSSCCRTSLQYLCCARLRQLLPDCVDSLEVLPLPPGLKQVLGNKLGWVLQMGTSPTRQRRDETPASPSCGSNSDSVCPSGRDACQRKRCRRI
ncbi:hypothetical protein FKM82_002732 [Ascaphus truei]